MLFSLPDILGKAKCDPWGASSCRAALVHWPRKSSARRCNGSVLCHRVGEPIQGEALGTSIDHSDTSGSCASVVALKAACKFLFFIGLVSRIPKQLPLAPLRYLLVRYRRRLGESRCFGFRSLLVPPFAVSPSGRASPNHH
jgi:hypothetical protein